MAGNWKPNEVVHSIEAALRPLADPKRAAGAKAYMKNVSDFLGIATPDRRAALKPIFKSLPDPTSDDIGKVALKLFALPQREFAYAAYDLISYFWQFADKDFLEKYVEELLTTKSWWDTVDGLGSAAVSPLTVKYPNKKLIEKWISSENMWLNRAAIQHQRGRRRNTDVFYVLQLCARFADSKEFFITKAVGWALRDISAFDKPAVRQYLRDHPQLHSVSVREAKRGLNR
jgi:3-methyladenine DNA glycosylase AlkD